MTERPILFSAPMVRAILEGRKTQTRRIAKLTDAGHVKEPGGHRRWHPADPDARQACPYGQPGDRLWVRETFGDCTPGADALVGTRWDKPWYRAEADEYGLLGHDGEGPVYVDDVKWRPSIHMPRRASRITLEITEVRVERLQEISEADAIAEGIERDGDGWRSYETIPSGPRRGEPHPHAIVPNRSATTSFRELWQSLNGPDSWDANPWVWIVGFRTVTP